jgi:hypothetical protein
MKTSDNFTLSARRAHFAAMETLWSGPPEQNPGGHALWVRLRRIECRANRAAVALRALVDAFRNL